MNDRLTIIVENGKVATISEYIDTQALARVSDDGSAIRAARPSCATEPFASMSD
ncbi:hypothetical protein [Rhizobium sp. BK379]|uniref:hypothetical protein n=1 Tax=Rhizobium sp. BK379 TaxID=2587059 RepID=UPI00184AA9D8|nr:hypothetical protein [Rhizobium sp. BK379]